MLLLAFPAGAVELTAIAGLDGATGGTRPVLTVSPPEAVQAGAQLALIPQHMFCEDAIMSSFPGFSLSASASGVPLRSLQGGTIVACYDDGSGAGYVRQTALGTFSVTCSSSNGVCTSPGSETCWSDCDGMCGVGDALSYFDDAWSVSATAEASIFSANPTNTHSGGNGLLYAGSVGTDEYARTIVRMPSGALTDPDGTAGELYSGSLDFTIASTSWAETGATLQLQAFVVDGDWQPGDSSGTDATGTPAAAGEVTWDERSAGETAWNTRGGDVLKTIRTGYLGSVSVQGGGTGAQSIRFSSSSALYGFAPDDVVSLLFVSEESAENAGRYVEIASGSFALTLDALVGGMDCNDRCEAGDELNSRDCDGLCDVGEQALPGECNGVCDSSTERFSSDCDGYCDVGDGDRLAGQYNLDCQGTCEQGDAADGPDCDGVCGVLDGAGSPDCDGVCGDGERFFAISLAELWEGNLNYDDIAFSQATKASMVGVGDGFPPEGATALQLEVDVDEHVLRAERSLDGATESRVVFEVAPASPWANVNEAQVYLVLRDVPGEELSAAVVSLYLVDEGDWTPSTNVGDWDEANAGEVSWVDRISGVEPWSVAGLPTDVLVAQTTFGELRAQGEPEVFVDVLASAVPALQALPGSDAATLMLKVSFSDDVQLDVRVYEGDLGIYLGVGVEGLFTADCDGVCDPEDHFNSDDCGGVCTGNRDGVCEAAEDCAADCNNVCEAGEVPGGGGSDLTVEQAYAADEGLLHADSSSLIYTSLSGSGTQLYFLESAVEYVAVWDDGPDDTGHALWKITPPGSWADVERALFSFFVNAAESAFASSTVFHLYLVDEGDWLESTNTGVDWGDNANVGEVSWHERIFATAASAWSEAGGPTDKLLATAMGSDVDDTAHGAGMAALNFVVDDPDAVALLQAVSGSSQVTVMLTIEGVGAEVTMLVHKFDPVQDDGSEGMRWVVEDAPSGASDCDGVCDASDEAESGDCDGVCAPDDAALGADCNGVCEAGELLGGEAPSLISAVEGNIGWRDSEGSSFIGVLDTDEVAAGAWASSDGDIILATAYPGERFRGLWKISPAQPWSTVTGAAFAFQLWFGELSIPDPFTTAIHLYLVDEGDWQESTNEFDAGPHEPNVGEIGWSHRVTPTDAWSQGGAPTDKLLATAVLEDVVESGSWPADMGILPFYVVDPDAVAHLQAIEGSEQVTVMIVADDENTELSFFKHDRINDDNSAGLQWLTVAATPGSPDCDGVCAADGSEDASPDCDGVCNVGEDEHGSVDCDGVCAADGSEDNSVDCDSLCAADGSEDNSVDCDGVCAADGSEDDSADCDGVCATDGNEDDSSDCDGECAVGEDGSADCDGVCAADGSEDGSADCDGVCAADGNEDDSSDCDGVCATDGNEDDSSDCDGECAVGEDGSADCDGVCAADGSEDGSADCDGVCAADGNEDDSSDCDGECAVGEDGSADCDGVCVTGEEGSADCDGTCDDDDHIESPDCATVCDNSGTCEAGEEGAGACSADCDGTCSVQSDALDSVDCNVDMVLLVDEVAGSIVDNDMANACETAVTECAGQLSVASKTADAFDATQTLVALTGANAACVEAMLTEAAKLGTSALTLLGTYDVLSLQFADKAFSLGSVSGDIIGSTSDVGTAYRSMQVEVPAGSSLPATDMSVSMPVNPGTTSKDVRVRLYGSTASAPVSPRGGRSRGRPAAVSYQETTFTVDANLAGTSTDVEVLDSPFLVCIDVGALGSPALLYYSEENNAWFNAKQTCIDYPIPDAVGVVKSVDETPEYVFGAPYSRVDTGRLCTWICHLTQYAVFDGAATTTGDPHFEGFRGGWYDFMGEAGKVFNLFTDTTLHVNARFVEFAGLPGQTYMGEIGILAGPHRITMAADGTVRVPDVPDCVLVNPALPNRCALRGGGYVRWSDDELVLEWDVYRLALTTEVWTFDHTDVEAHGLGYSMAVNHGALARSGRADTWAPHGVHGQVADVQHVVVGAGKQGEGVVAGHFRDYEVASGDLFGVDVMHAQWSESAVAVESSDDADWAEARAQ